MKAELKDITTNIRMITGTLEKGQKWRLFGALFLMILVGCLTNIPPVVLGRLIDRFIDAQMVFNSSLPFLGIIFLSVLVREAIQVFRKYLVEDTCTRVEKSTRLNLVKHLLRLNLSYFTNNRTGALHGRINRSLEGLVKLIKLSFLDFLPSLFVAFFALGVVLVKAPVLGGVMAMVIPVGILIVFKQVASQKGIRIVLLRGKEDIDGTVVELLGGIENVRAMNSEAYESSRVEVVSEHLRAKEIVHHIYMAFFDAAKYINEGVFHILVLGLAIWLAARGTITTGDILTYSMLFVSVIAPLREIHRILDEAHESSIRTTDLFDMMSLSVDPSFINKHATSDDSDLSQEKAIEVSNLSLTYGDSIRVLDKINIDIKAGEFVGIVGPTGCGKSTVLKGLLGLNHPQTGTIMVNGQKLGEITRSEIAEIFCYISQNPFIVSGTVYENIIYGLKRKSTEKEVENAAQMACIHNEIIQFSNGYATEVGEGGCKLSGGQRQRIAIARAFLRKPSILILDEATSALDSRTETAVQQSIEKLLGKSTVVAVAHRLSTLSNADRLYVMEAGKVTQHGSFEELAHQQGLFSELQRSSIFSQKTPGMMAA